MYISEWVKEVKGKVYDIDNIYIGQCVDGFYTFNVDFGIPWVTCGNGYANGLWLYRREYYSQWFYLITDLSTLQDGDWVVWDRGSYSACPDSHIAMYWKGKFFGENQGGHPEFTFASIKLNGALGAFRPNYVQAYPPKKTKTVDELAHEVIEGFWGNGADRVNRLTAQGYDYNAVQARVNQILSGYGQHTPDEIRNVALQVINGMYGNGEQRRQRLESAGYDYDTVQAEVNRLLYGW